MSTFSQIYRNTRMPASNPCEKCKRSATCDQICIERARWWDRAMEKIRRVLKCS